VKPFPTKSAARTIARVLAGSFPLYRDDPESRRRWSTLPAVKIIAALQNAYTLQAPDHAREDLVGIVADTLMKAPPRPNGSRAARHEWRVETTILIADALAPVVKLKSKPMSGILFSPPGEPTWR
jgi:hypothetical protein